MLADELSGAPVTTAASVLSFSSAFQLSFNGSTVSLCMTVFVFKISHTTDGHSRSICLVNFRLPRERSTEGKVIIIIIIIIIHFADIFERESHERKGLNLSLLWSREEWWNGSRLCKTSQVIRTYSLQY